ncbi:hypothetical protein KO497_08425 [Pacificibacter marinus]|nr:hypothetical protein [Pacificibacter marinus]
MSPIIIPIVTAAGLTIPKTSSHTITFATGTADSMKVMARVDLSSNELRRVVEMSRGEPSASEIYTKGAERGALAAADINSMKEFEW